MADVTFHRWSEIEPEQMNPELTRQYISGAQCMVATLGIKKGGSVPRHHHHNEQIAYILSGALEFTIAAEGQPEVKHVVRAGEVLVIPSNVPHSAVALEDTVDLDIFAPPRQDWLDKNDSYMR